VQTKLLRLPGLGRAVPRRGHASAAGGRAGRLRHQPSSRARRRAGPLPGGPPGPPRPHRRHPAPARARRRRAPPRRSTSLPATAAARRPRPSRRKRWTCSGAITGRSTCASCSRSSSARCASVDGSVVGVEDLPEYLQARTGAAAPWGRTTDRRGPLKKAIEELERRHILRALEHTKGNKRRPWSCSSSRRRRSTGASKTSASTRNPSSGHVRRPNTRSTGERPRASCFHENPVKSRDFHRSRRWHRRCSREPATAARGCAIDAQRRREPTRGRT
jgi:hypothetical protein